MKKCSSCGSISSDTENSCGVCGGSLHQVSSESLEQATHNLAAVRPRRKTLVGALALIILAISTIGGGTALLLVQNGFGLVLLVVGLLLTLAFAGGVGVGIAGRGRAGYGKAAMRRSEAEQEDRERKRRRGEED